MSRTQTQYRIRVAAPFRLDLTVSALRRLSTNIVDLITADAEYVRVFGGTGRPVITRVKQVSAEELLVDFEGGLDQFPMNDSSVVRNLAFVAGTTHLEIDEVLAALGAQRGMLYYYLLLARLEMRGDVGRASTAPAA
jgi:hypothetical protein